MKLDGNDSDSKDQKYFVSRVLASFPATMYMENPCYLVRDRKEKREGGVEAKTPNARFGT